MEHIFIGDLLLQEKFYKLFSFLYQWLLKPDFLPYWAATLSILQVVFLRVRFCNGKKQRTTLQALAFAMMVAYYFLVYSYTVLTRPEYMNWQIELMPFWSYCDVIFDHSETQLLCILINIAMLAPIGFLIPFWKRETNWKRVLLVAAVMSYLVECSQLVLHRGDFELFDDPMNNIMGCMIGYLIGRFVEEKFPGVWQGTRKKHLPA